MSESPFQTMQSAAVGLHELFTSYINAGFTRFEAFQLVKAIMVATIQQPPTSR